MNWSFIIIDGVVVSGLVIISVLGCVVGPQSDANVYITLHVEFNQVNGGIGIQTELVTSLTFDHRRPYITIS